MSRGRRGVKASAEAALTFPEATRPRLLGVTILTGTDLAIPHGRVAHEAIRLHQLGLSKKATLHAVTTAAFDYLGIEHGFSPGMPADAVFFADDPREHLETLLEPRVIVRSGRIIGA